MHGLESLLHGGNTEILKYAVGVGAGAVGLAGLGAGLQTSIYEYHDKKIQKEGVLLKILTKESTDLKETEKLIKNIHSMLLNTKLRKIRYGRPFMSFEIAAVYGSMSFYIFVPKDMKDRIVDRIYASYPDIAIEVKNGDYIPEMGKKDKCYTCELVLGQHHTLKVKNKGDKDILASILSGMKDLNKGEFAAVQILTRPLDNNWQHKGKNALAKFENDGTRLGDSIPTLSKFGDAFSRGLSEVDKELSRQGVSLDLSSGGSSRSRKTKFDRREIIVAAEKLMEPGMETVIRVVSIGSYKKGNTSRVKSISAAFNELDADNKFKKDLVYSHQVVLNNFKKRKPYLYGRDNILTPSELSSFFLRLPGDDLIEKFPDIERLKIKQFAPPDGSCVSKNRKGVIFAKNSYRGSENLLEIKDLDLTRHIVIQGKTGTGKSEFMKTMFKDHISNIRDENGNIIRKGRGAMVLEPHGKLSSELLEIIPEDRRKDTIVFDLFSDYPWPFNFCKVPDRESENMTRDQLAQKTLDEALEVFKRNFSDVWSEKNEFYIKNAIKTIMETSHTMVELPRLFADKKFRDSIIPLISDTKLKKFWINNFGYGEKSKFKIDSSTESTAKSVEYKLEKFLDSKELMRVVGQNDCIDFKEILDEDKIVIFKFSKDKMSKDRISFIGGIAVKLISVAAFARDKSKWDTPYIVFVDEAQNFINESFKDIYYELRKYGVCLTLMHQELEQMKEVPGLINAIYNNVGTSITFATGKLDAPFFEGIYGPRIDQKDLMKLPQRYGYCKLLINGHTSDTFNIYSLDRPEVTVEEGIKSIKEIQEYNKKGRMHVDEIDKMIEERFAENSYSYEDIDIDGFAVELDEEKIEDTDKKPGKVMSMWDED